MQRKPRKNIQAPDLNQTKYTPRTRPVHQAAHSGQLKNADPNKKYVMAPSNENHPFGYQFYESMGYKIEICEKDGVRIELGTKPVIGKPLEWAGNYLLSTSKENAERIFLEGPTGSTGQLYYDKLMKNIRTGMLEKRAQVDGLQEEWQVEELQQNAAPEIFRG